MNEIINKCLVCGKKVEPPRKVACSNDCFEESQRIAHTERALLRVLQSNELLRELTGFTGGEARNLIRKLLKNKDKNLIYVKENT